MILDISKIWKGDMIMARPYSQDLRKRVILKREQGKTVREIAVELNTSRMFVYDMLKLYKATGSLKPKEVNRKKKVSK